MRQHPSPLVEVAQDVVTALCRFRQTFSNLRSKEGATTGIPEELRQVVVELLDELTRTDAPSAEDGHEIRRSAVPVATAGADLTPREQVVALLAARGLANREIAEELFVSVKTVEYHLTSVYTKLHVRSRWELRRLFST